MRLDLDIPLVAGLLLAAASAQELAPAASALPQKVPFLTAVALYFFLRRPVAVALTAAVWAGWLTDALGGLPLFCTATFLLALYLVCRLVQRMFLEATWVQGALLVACAAPAQAVWTRVMAGVPAASARELWAGVGTAVPAGLAAGLAGFAVCGLAERAAGLAERKKEGHGVLWTEAGR